MSVRMDPIQVLPKEVVITHLISTLSFNDIKSCIRVCKKWRVLFNDDTIWRRFFVDHRFIGTYPPKRMRRLFLEINDQTIRSNDEMIQRIKAFCNKIENGQNGKWTCCLQQNPQFDRVTVNFFTSKDVEKGITLRENWYLQNDINAGALPTRFTRRNWNFVRAIDPVYKEMEFNEQLRTCRYTKSAFRAATIFPSKISATFNECTNLEVQIEKVIKNRIYELSDVEVRKAVISLILVLVIGILLIGAGGYVIGKLKGHRI